jgi:glycosyltransferase involved in cell wall biosynthesis
VTELSIVVPVWNEEEIVGGLLEELEREVAAGVGDAEIVVVDDASTDATPAILAERARANERLRVLRAERNRGHGPSVRRGFEEARGDWIFQLDSDGQFVVSEFWRLWPRRREADLVLGVRVRRHDPLHRLVLTRAVRLVVSALAARPLRDANVPFRLLRRALWEDLRSFIGPDTLAPQILVTMGAAVRGWRIVEVPVSHLPRERGQSSLRALRLVRFSLRGLGQLLRFRYELGQAPARGA